MRGFASTDMRTKRVVATASGIMLTLAASIAPVPAHHSTAMYDMSQRKSIRGTIKTVEWTNAQLLIFNVHGSGQTHVVERVHLADPVHLQIDTSVEDPVVLADPWRYSATYERSNLVMGEVLCDNKNNRERGPDLDLTPPSQTP